MRTFDAGSARLPELPALQTQRGRVRDWIAASAVQRSIPSTTGPQSAVRLRTLSEDPPVHACILLEGLLPAVIVQPPDQFAPVTMHNGSLHVYFIVITRIAYLIESKICISSRPPVNSSRSVSTFCVRSGP